MSIKKITYTNKTAIQNDTSIADENKVTDNDMNEIKDVVNNNSDELSTAQSNIEDLQSGQGTANTDITNLKSRVSTLETDNTTNKSDISTLKSDNATNKSNIQELQEKQEQSESNISTLQTRTSTLETKMSTVEEEITSLQSDNTTNKSNIQQLQNNQQETGTNVETLQEKVTTLETDNIQNKSDINALKTDNETNKSNISTLQEEQETQNANIEDLQENDTNQDELILKLQQENEQIKGSLINVETEQAKSLHIEDGSTVSAQLSVEGNAEQKTREGYNLLNSSLFDLSSASSLATYNGDGTITFNGTISEDNNVNIRSLRKQTIAGTGNENLVVKIISGSLTGIIRLVAQDTDYGNIKYSQIGTSSYTNKLTENIEYNIFSITFENGTVMNNLKLGFMIVDDSDLDKEYEQYGAKPSLDYLSKVKCLGDNKNLLNDEIFKNVTIENSSSISSLSNTNADLEHNGHYCARIYFTDGTYVTDNNFVLYGYNSNNQPVAIFNNTSINNINNVDEISYIKLIANSTGIETYKNKTIKGIKIEEVEENGIATSYSPYRTR